MNGNILLHHLDDFEKFWKSRFRHILKFSEENSDMKLKG